MKCCICGRELEEKDMNDPYGALNKKGELIGWLEDDYCCGFCNERYVIPGRLAVSYNASKKDIQRIMPDNLV